MHNHIPYIISLLVSYPLVLNPTYLRSINPSLHTTFCPHFHETLAQLHPALSVLHSHVPYLPRRSHIAHSQPPLCVARAFTASPSPFTEY
jgi:hypothetical protein